MLLPPPPIPFETPTGVAEGGLRGLAPATWVEKRGGWWRERGRRDACSRFPYRRGTVVCAFMKICQTLSLRRSTAPPPPLLLASSPSISLLSLARLRSSFPQLLSPADVADLGVMTYRVSSARRSQTPFLWPPLCLPRSFHLSSVNFFPGLFGWPGRAAVSRCLG